MKIKNKRAKVIAISLGHLILSIYELHQYYRTKILPFCCCVTVDDGLWDVCWRMMLMDVVHVGVMTPVLAATVACCIRDDPVNC